MTTEPGPRLEVTDGPYLLHGSLPLRTADAVTSEKGEPMTWTFGAPRLVDGTADAPVALCRCGHSGDKPFCDGSHNHADWDGTCTPPEATMAERARTKAGTGLTLVDDGALCVHAGFCGTEKHTVWSMMSDTDDTEIRATVIRMVEKCPSGRLVNEIDGEWIEPSLATEIGVVPDGPLWVTGGVPVEVPDGVDQPVETRNRVTLCRCGASSIKPLCDGSHADTGFSAGGLT